jgi:hypothetical protein
MRQSGREKEADAIRAADRASILGRLMLGELDDWEQFLKPDTIDYCQLPRRQLKAGHADVRKRLSKEINKFFAQNFSGLNAELISNLYDAVKRHRGLEIPLHDFEATYGKVNPVVLQGNPSHLTVSITLWGLKFLFPEDILAKDIVIALQLIQDSEKGIEKYLEQSHSSVQGKTKEFLPFIRTGKFAQRSLILCCFNLMEAYLNGLAWDYCQSHDLKALSNRKVKLLTDTSTASIRDKITKYPSIISGQDEVKLEDSQTFLDLIKPYRDSLVHPSPFSAPQKFGGYQKLKKLYELDKDIAIQAAEATTSLIKNIDHFVPRDKSPPLWLAQIDIGAAKGIHTSFRRFVKTIFDK